MSINFEDSLILFSISDIIMFQIPSNVLFIRNILLEKYFNALIRLKKFTLPEKFNLKIISLYLSLSLSPGVINRTFD